MEEIKNKIKLRAWSKEIKQFKYFIDSLSLENLELLQSILNTKIKLKNLSFAEELKETNKKYKIF